jgi:hypothetical protein
MHALRFNGIASTELSTKMGPATEYLLYKATENILFGKSLRIARPLAKPKEIQMQRLGGDAPNKSYSYMSNIATPQSEVRLSLSPSLSFSISLLLFFFPLLPSFYLTHLSLLFFSFSLLLSRY